MALKTKLKRFNDNVLGNFQMYNSVFTGLPFDSISSTGVMLPLFHETCEKGFQNKKNPTEIIEYFFQKYHDNPSEEEQVDLMFRFIQYIERQVVLFDAIEDSAFPIINNMNGLGTLRNIKEVAKSSNKREELVKYLNDFKVRIVLTAHPTQFYPGTVLGIITDLTKAIKEGDLVMIKKLLAQLGKTQFFKQQKPTPFDEAVNLIWYLENVFYHSFSKISNYIENNIAAGRPLDNEVINIGFWPGGDRDGNPFVTTEITLQVAERLRHSLMTNYFRDLRKLKRRLTFEGVKDPVFNLEKRIYEEITFPIAQRKQLKLEEFKNELRQIRATIIEKHKSLFLDELDDLIHKVNLFGFHFATLDIRQDSRVHHNAFTELVEELQNEGDTTFPVNYASWSADEQVEFLSTVKGKIKPEGYKDEVLNKTIGSIYALKTIQKKNGELGCNRYIISNNQTALNVMQTFAMLNLCGFGGKLPVDVIPLFETVDDLLVADKVMEQLYQNKAYMKHLKNRKFKQTIMLGFSDGTKDGGYLMANWGIYKAKENLTAMSRKYGIKVIFFDGRGGPPARGGGKTHQFYASFGPTIENQEIQLTIQGQTISSNFGTLESSQYNLEQLLSAGISNELFSGNRNVLSKNEKELLNDMANTSYQAYVDFKNHPKFLPYLEQMSTLQFYAKTNIGSRPSKRSKSAQLNFSDLRAIPFVGSWSQLKQNVPGFFGVGTAIKKYEDKGELQKIKDLYENSDFFKTLLENSMMSLSKSFFELTSYMADDPEFGAFWKLIYAEYELSKRLILEVAGHTKLMETSPEGKASIEVREHIVLPLLTIQQYALRKIQELKRQSKPDLKQIEVYEKIVTRSLFGNINASRNSA
ncbi:MAG: phosphoenolpyruvate carboxylase [Bacteroidetes bacterium MedPE-SWsnd-G1]|nr:MAG: phosphoenolpyruvate carboxylase [Bacteroidetes bacterium MedPE-SWsnd-G1]